jgi:hypothetical protein
MTSDMAFRDALDALNKMKAEGVVEEYAIAGAMALVFWTEPVPTWDLDVLVFLPPATGPLVSLEGVYAWASARGYALDKEHVASRESRHSSWPRPAPLATRPSRLLRRSTTRE